VIVVTIGLLPAETLACSILAGLLSVPGLLRKRKVNVKKSTPTAARDTALQPQSRDAMGTSMHVVDWGG